MAASGQGPRARAAAALAVVLAAAVLAASCSASISVGGGDDTTTTSSGGQGQGSWDELVQEVLADVEDYWAAALPEVSNVSYEPISGGFHPYDAETPTPPCGPEAMTYEEVAGNLFYCRPADYIAWDEEGLAANLYEDYGPFAVALVFAHEFGHAVQERLGVDGPTIYKEQQADCFAGAWGAWVANGHSRRFELDLADLDQGLAGFLTMRDLPGTGAFEPDAHGSGFDRVAAFQDGFLEGASACVAYVENPPTVLALPWASAADQQAGGNLPYEEVEPLVVADLEDFWSTLVAQEGGTWTPISGVYAVDPQRDQLSCGGRQLSVADMTDAAFYCASDDYIAWDEVGLMPWLYREIGDFAMAITIANQYSAAAQERAGLRANDPLAFSLQADCLTGTWAASVFLENRATAFLRLVPGDLDKAIVAFLAFGDAPEDVEAGEGQKGTAFQRVSAFRDGVLNGIDECALYDQGAPAQ